MFDIISDKINKLLNLNAESQVALILTYVVLIVMMTILCLIVHLITKKILLSTIKKIVIKTANKFDEILYEKKVFHRLALISSALVAYIFAYNFGNYSDLVQRLIFSYIIVIIALVSFKILDSVVEVYRQKKYAKNVPIKGFIQLIKIILLVFTGLFILVIFTDNGTAKSLLGGIGGMSAILILVFRDSILGLVASIQLSANNLLKIGDWVEMPQYNADGEVVDVSLSKVIVRNWDKTYTTIPAYKFLDESFINWEGMSQSGGRRIKRSLYIDMTSIGFLTEEQIEKLLKINLLKEYLNGKIKEINEFNKEKKVNTTELYNGRRLTNIGTFRAYALEYIKNHPFIHKDYTIMVRQLAPTEKGLPLEVYCFTNDTNWLNYEGIQADIFDHLISIVNEFGLVVYQSPSSVDIGKIFSTNI